MNRVGTGLFAAGVVALACGAATRLPAQDSAAAARNASTSTRFRHRLLNAYDEQSGAPIEGLEVVDVQSGTTALTTKTGTVSLAFLPNGKSLVLLRKVGFTPVTMSVDISPADTAPLTVVMRRAAQELPAVVTEDSIKRYISPGLQGFDERMRAGLGGQFIAESTLRIMDGEILANALRRFRGAMFNGGRMVSTRTPVKGPVLQSHTLGGTCAVAVYENGVRLALPPNFERITVDAYAGVEFYAGPETYPAWISPTDNDCGVLLLWTRER